MTTERREEEGGARASVPADAQGRNQAAEDRDRAGEGRDRAALGRDVEGAERDRIARGRDRAGHHRDELADQRDQAAERRDETAARRDQAARESEAGQDGFTLEGLKRTTIREEAAADRQQSSQDRHAGAGERRQAELDRGISQLDRGEGAQERSRAGLDRSTAWADRTASAQERGFASHDDLTGTYLRGTGFVELGREIARARRTEQPLAVAFVDVDHLKDTNDSRGHAAGDRVLLEVAQALRANLRSYDLIIRYGGDEFVCAIWGMDTAEASQRLALVNRALALLPERPSVTMGLAQLRPEDTAQDLLARADAALYQERQRDRGTTA
ncbi:MAG: hypothetical protein NVSMB32_06040 [Actinomycetota bacterium]